MGSGVGSRRHTDVPSPQEIAKDVVVPGLATHPFWSAYTLVDEPLGRGSSSVVYLARNTATGAELAAKVVPLTRMEDAVSIANEIEILTECLHASPEDYILRLERAFPDIGILLLERGTCDLLRLMNDCYPQGMPPDRAVRVLIQLASALAYLHKRGIVHGDIKLQNVVVMLDSSVRLADMGSAYRWRHTRRAHYGTRRASPPECFGPGRVAIGPKADVWAYGVVAYALLTGTHPFQHVASNEELRSAVESGTWDAVPWTLSLDAHDFVSGALCVDPERRSSMTQLLAHPWLHLAT
jgi:serine/threonine protein kinase